MVNSKIQDKTLSQTQEPQNSKHDSITNVNFSDYAAVRYFRNRRVVLGVRVDEGLAERFKQLAKQVYGSVCRAVEVYMVNFIEACERGVNFCYTSKPVKIEKVVIERNLRPRRKLEFERGGSESERFYCPLDDEWVPFESLPLQSCLNCPNNGCRKYVMSLADREVVSNE